MLSNENSIPRNQATEIKMSIVKSTSKKYCRITDVADADYSNMPLIKFIKIVGKVRPLNVYPSPGAKHKTKDFNVGIRTITQLSNAQSLYKVTRGRITTSEVRSLLKRYYNVPLQQFCLILPYNAVCILEAILVLVKKYKILEEQTTLWDAPYKPSDVVELFMKKQYNALDVAEAQSEAGRRLLQSLRDVRIKYPLSSVL